METDWYANEIIDGLTKLLSLSLDHCPASDLVQITAATWIDATTADHAWERERDTARIRTAFTTLARTVRRWPQPRDFLDALPRVEQKALAYEVKPVTKAEADARMAQIRRLLNEPMPSFKPEPKPEREGMSLAEAERQLHAHYADRKSAAAGDTGADA